MRKWTYDELDIRCAFEAGILDAEDSAYCNGLLKDGRQKELNEFLDRRFKDVDDQMRPDDAEVAIGCLCAIMVIALAVALVWAVFGR